MRYVASDIAVLTEERPTTCEVHSVDPVGMSRESAQLYIDRYAAGSVLLRESRRFTSPGAIFCDHMLEDYDAYVKSLAYQEYFRPLGAEHMLKLQLEHRVGWVTSLVFRRRKASGPYSASELRRARQLTPHLVNSFRHRHRLLRERVTTAPVATLIEQLGMALVIVDSADRARFANGSAELLLSAGRFLTIQGGRLASAEPLARAALGRLLSGARQARTSTEAASTLLSEVCNDGGIPATVSAIPLGPALTGRMGLTNEPSTMLLIDTPQRAAEQDARLCLTQMFGLTPAESEIAVALHHGQSVSEIASLRMSSREAIRFHLKGLFDKLGVRSQPQLVRRIGDTLSLLWGAQLDRDRPRP